MNNNLIFFILDKLTGEHITSVSFCDTSTLHGVIKSAQRLIKKAWEEFAMTPQPSPVAFTQYLLTRYPVTFATTPTKETEYQAYCTVLVNRNPNSIDDSFGV